MGEILRGIFEWVAHRGGLLGSLALVLLGLLLGYALVMFVISSLRALFQTMGRPAGAESRLVGVTVAIIRCVVSVAFLAWYVSFAVREFPGWLGI